MTGALGRWRTAAAEQLRAAGLDAVEAMEPERAARRRGPALAVALAGVSCGSGGFQNYLGTEETAEGGRRELYGRAVELTLRLDVLAPRDGGASRPAREAAERGGPGRSCLLPGGPRGGARWNGFVPWGKTEYLEAPEGPSNRLAVRCRCGGVESRPGAR